MPIGPAIERFRELMDDAPWNASIKDAQGQYLYLNRHYLATLGDRFGADWYGKTDTDIWPPDNAARMREIDALALGGAAVPLFSLVRPFADGPHTFVLMKFPLPTDAGPIVLGGVGLDLTEHARAEAQHDRLAAAIEQATESIEITDLEGRITYVNPAFERATGYGRDEVIGRNPRILKTGAQSPAFYEAMWATLTSGRPWVGDLVNRRKDGSTLTEAAVISPIRDAHGEITGYVAGKRDVTQARAVEGRSAALSRQRALIARTIREIRAGDTVEAVAQAICQQVINLPELVKAQIFLFELDGRATPIGTVVPGDSHPPVRPLPRQRGRHLRERASEGPWIEPWVNRPWHPYNQFLNALGVQAAAYAPIRHGDRLIGLLIADSPRSVAEGALVEELPALVEFADLAGALIGRRVMERTELGRARETIATIIERQSFQSVFQPIIRLADDTAVGFEALTRFTDGIDPEVRFAEAATVGLGLRLEAATLEAALTAAATLPPRAWLDVNVSPEFVLEGVALRGVLSRHHGRRVVLEVTEHEVISDYQAFREAITRIGPRFELAVDDTGAGFASLRHILELHPAFLKLDRWLVEGLDRDEARQAMVVGIGHFARSAGCRIVAEGIETDAERETLRALGIEFGQGYLLGRPLPAASSSDDRLRRHGR
ncbi:MAG TPA: EAL domain-containing protein [Candidatus Baltobacteraceae bacterium]|nr:EAL domain-containing protein [Candidatus Baltobacteraceae bacterium]